jgi:hypothetical protein
VKIQVSEFDGAFRVVAEGVPHFAEDGRQLYDTTELVAEGLAGKQEADQVAKEYVRIVERRVEALAGLARLRLGEPRRLVLDEPAAIGRYLQQGDGVYRVIGSPTKTEGHRVRPLLEVTPLEWSALQAEVSAAGMYPSKHLTDLPPEAEAESETEESHLQE